MTDAEVLSLIQQDLRTSATDIKEIKTLLAVVADKAHNSPCEPMQKQVIALKQEQDQARGGLRMVKLILIAVLAVFSAITGGVAALIAIFK